MNKIENILDNLLKEYPDLIEQKNAIRKVLLWMQESSPNIQINADFKQSLKNKLEVQAYAKIKNTQTKKINIAEQGPLSFKKDAKSIFEKPKLNFFKILSPLFVGAFALFWFFHFFWDNLFTIKGWGELEYIPVQVQEEGIDDTVQWDVILEKEINVTEDNNQLEIIKKEPVQINDIADNITVEVQDEKIEVKNSIAERIKKRNAAKSLEREVEKVKAEDDFTKKLINEMEVDKKITVPVIPAAPVVSETINSNQDTDLSNVPESINVEETTVNTNATVDIVPQGTEFIKDDPSVNTELIDILWDESINTESIVEWASFDSMGASLAPTDNTSADDSVIEESWFELFCEEKWWTITGTICSYWEFSCSKENFDKDVCE